MRDSAALAGVLGYRLARLSVHDSIDGTRLNDILTEPMRDVDDAHAART